ncbi:MAG: hypothetical protein KAY24_02610 [Candidatus Eisenbacteria sp.]|nr:hypothetical protein [Candidatus Eisenbacteria bacterium]
MFQWTDNEGMHVAAPGSAPTLEQLQKMNEEYQQQIRNSPMWDVNRSRLCDTHDLLRLEVDDANGDA